MEAGGLPDKVARRKEATRSSRYHHSKHHSIGPSATNGHVMLVSAPTASPTNQLLLRHLAYL